MVLYLRRANSDSWKTLTEASGGFLSKDLKMFPEGKIGEKGI